MADSETLKRLRTGFDLADSLGYSLSKIEKITGVSRAWSSAFRLGKIENPGIKNIEILLTFFDSLRAK